MLAEIHFLAFAPLLETVPLSLGGDRFHKTFTMPPRMAACMHFEQE
jgi:hypothetical protein